MSWKKEARRAADMDVAILKAAMDKIGSEHSEEAIRNSEMAYFKIFEKVCEVVQDLTEEEIHILMGNLIVQVTDMSTFAHSCIASDNMELFYKNAKDNLTKIRWKMVGRK